MQYHSYRATQHNTSVLWSVRSNCTWVEREIVLRSVIYTVTLTICGMYKQTKREQRPERQCRVKKQANKIVNQRSKDVIGTEQQRPESGCTSGGVHIPCIRFTLYCRSGESYCRRHRSLLCSFDALHFTYRHKQTKQKITRDSLRVDRYAAKRSTQREFDEFDDTKTLTARITISLF